MGATCNLGPGSQGRLSLGSSRDQLNLILSINDLDIKPDELAEAPIQGEQAITTGAGKGSKISVGLSATSDWKGSSQPPPLALE